ncbi:unnamed protein product [Amaranthus hypochondriacus]
MSTSNKNNAKIIRNTTLLEALAKRGSVTSYTSEDGMTKIKILVKKQDLKQILKSMNNANYGNNNFTCRIFSFLPSSIEKRFNDLMKKKGRQANYKECQSSNWRPTLHSIPEEY